MAYIQESLQASINVSCHVVGRFQIYHLFIYLLLLFGHTHGLLKFLGKWLNLSHSTDDAMSLTHYATKELFKYTI